MGLIIPPATTQGEVEGGNILLANGICAHTWKQDSMIFQDPMSALNLVYVGDQISEVIMLHNNVSKAEARVMAEETLETVGISRNRYDEYPHKFSAV